MLKVAVRNLFTLAFFVSSVALEVHAAVHACMDEFGMDEIMVVKPADISEEQIRLERHSLKSLVVKDPTKNLTFQHPFMIMNAAQRYQAFNTEHPPIRVVDPSIGGGMVNHYPLYQDPLPENDGLFIEGQYNELEVFHEAIRAAAIGDGSAVKTLTFVGPAGTGKTLFLDIMGKIAEFKTTRVPESFMYTFEWVNLKEIPELYELLRLVPNPDGSEKEDLELPFPSAIYESPFTLLPKEFQDSVLNMVSPVVERTIGTEPRPIRKPNPQNKFLRDAVIDHYTRKSGKKTLGPAEIVDVLSKHVLIKRHILGADGKTGKVGYQGKDIDWGGLVVSENPIIKAMYGADHPFAYNYNGKILQSQGGFLLFDEFWRNELAFRDFTLDVQESRIVQKGGAHAIQLDAVILAAANTESVEKAKQDGTAKAQLDRARLEYMGASTVPFHIMRTMMLMKSLKNIRQKPLIPLEATRQENFVEPTLEPADLNTLYPLRTNPDDSLRGVEGRYAISYSPGRTLEPVSIAPWTIPFVAYVVAASRMETDAAIAQEKGDFSHALQTHVFGDEIARLKAMLGMIPLTISQAEELRSLSNYMMEGSNGISTRDAANIWLTEIINAAQRPGNDHTATPVLAKKSFIKLLERGTLKPRNNQERLRWLSLLDRVSKDLILPRIKADIAMALAEGSEDMNAVYEEVFRELTARNTDPAAKMYQTSDRRHAPINEDRLRAINELFVKNENRPFPANEIISLEAAYAISPEDAQRKRSYHPGLMDALRQYHADLVLKQVSFGSYVKISRGESGNAREREHYDQFVNALEVTLGYNKRAIRDAIEIFNGETSATRQTGE